MVLSNPDCPYCNFKGHVWFNENESRKLATCSLDEGGCDRQYIVDLHAVYTIEVRKIEGEETRK